MRLGCDPEVFLMNNSGLVPIFGMIGADKWNPKQVDGLPPGFTFQEDNVALEFGIPPASTEEEFVDSVQKVQFTFLKQHPDYTFCKLSCAAFPKDALDANAQAFLFGCEPDFNAWTNKQNPKLKLKVSHKYTRSAGGHVHVETKLDPVRVIQAMDLYLGVPSILMDKDDARRELYGKAGAHRVKPYGVEYRTLSNFWIFDEKYIRWIWRQSERALMSVELGEDYKPAAADIQRVINTNNKEDAELIVKAMDLEIV